MATSEKESDADVSQTEKKDKASAGAGETAGNAAAMDVNSLQQALQEAEQRAQDHWDHLLRNKAELDNVRKRQARELEDAHKFALERFIQDLLPVRDSMEMGLDAAGDNVDIGKLREGIDLTLKMLISSLDKVGLEVISPEKGEKLNPEIHQAMSLQEDAQAESNTILTVAQKGYLLNGRLIRPAMVIVAKASGKKQLDIQKDQDKQGNDTGSQLDEQA